MSNFEKMNFKTPKIETKPDEVIVPLHAEEISRTTKTKARRN